MTTRMSTQPVHRSSLMALPPRLPTSPSSAATFPEKRSPMPVTLAISILLMEVCRRTRVYSPDLTTVLELSFVCRALEVLALPLDCTWRGMNR